MKKPAPVAYPILPILAERWSPLAFASTPVEPEKLKQIFEAARWAASSSNEQPWSFVIATSDNPADFERLADCLVPGNAWAKRAPVLVLSVARNVLSGKDQANRWAFHDVGLATGNLLTQVMAEGLFAHPMAGFDIEKARATLALPEHHEPVAMIAIGHYGNSEALQEYQREREANPRVRKPIDQFVFAGQWGRQIW